MGLPDAILTNHNYGGACTVLMLFVVIVMLFLAFGFHSLGFLSIFANVEFMVWISYHDILVRISRYGFPIWIAYCGFQCLDVLSGCTFRFSKRGNQVDG